MEEGQALGVVPYEHVPRAGDELARGSSTKKGCHPYANRYCRKVQAPEARTK